MPHNPDFSFSLGSLAFSFGERDFFFGSSDGDRFNGGVGNDVLFGRGGTDTLRGGRGDDFLDGGTGADTLFGGGGRDTLIGGSGSDMLNGGGGADRLLGGSGDDRIEGGRGDDQLLGGEGADVFLFNPNRAREGDDVIVDFELGTDKIGLSVEDVLASTPGLLGEDGEFQPSDLDVSDLWDIVAADSGNAAIVHPNGTIELGGVAFDESLTFEAVFDAVVELV